MLCCTAAALASAAATAATLTAAAESCVPAVLSALPWLLSPPPSRVPAVRSAPALPTLLSPPAAGWRKNHEDAHIAHHYSEECHLFGVFDGHGGPEVRVQRVMGWAGRGVQCAVFVLAGASSTSLTGAAGER